jgi:hypothetical protein
MFSESLRVQVTTFEELLHDQPVPDAEL